MTRQMLFREEDFRGCEARYFQVEPGGYSSIERHAHVHAVLVLHGRGRVLVGDAVRDTAPFDLIRVPPMTWHQFLAADDGPLGFLCLVSADRDRPRRPTEAEVRALRNHPVVGPHVRVP